MKRITTCTKGMLLTCTALAFAFAGCTSSSTPETGGIDAQLELNPGTTLQQDVLLLKVTFDCPPPAVDPYDPGKPWQSETIDVITEFTGPDDEGADRPMFGLIKKEGLPAGECTVTIDAMSDDGSVTCKGQKAGIVVVPPENTFVDIRVSCVADTRHGGIGVDAEFNQCAEYEQIVVSPTSVSIPNPGEVDIWCRDLDEDDMLAAVQLVTYASFCPGGTPGDDPDKCAAPADPGDWDSCGTISGVAGPQFIPCMDGEKLDLSYTCDTAGACVVAIAMSDDNFAGALTGMRIPFGCDGTDPNASALIPVTCQSLTECGNGAVETPPEECDRNAPGAVPPTEPFYGTDGTNGTWCSTTCKIIADVCADTTTAPPSPDGCSQPADPCQQAGCDSTATDEAGICTGDENADGASAGGQIAGSCDDNNGCTDTSGRGCSCQQAPDECFDSNGDPTGTLCPNGNQQCGPGETCAPPLLTCEETPACTVENGDPVGCAPATTCAAREECVGGECQPGAPTNNGASCVAGSGTTCHEANGDDTGIPCDDVNDCNKNTATDQTCSAATTNCFNGACLALGTCTNGADLNATCEFNFACIDDTSLGFTGVRCPIGNECGAGESCVGPQAIWPLQIAACSGGLICSGDGECVSTCLQGNEPDYTVAPTASQACADPYGVQVDCIGDNCVLDATGLPTGPCFPDQDTQACTECRAFFQCDSAFYVTGGDVAGACATFAP